MFIAVKNISKKLSPPEKTSVNPEKPDPPDPKNNSENKEPENTNANGTADGTAVELSTKEKCDDELYESDSDSESEERIDDKSDKSNGINPDNDENN